MTELSYRLLQGDVSEKLRELPNDYVQCVVTSPPYWGLRDYGMDPIVFGGEPGCEHEWGAEGSKRNRWGLDKNVSDLQMHNRGNAWEVSQGAFCRHCGAWRGQLGLEPVPDCLGWATGQPCGQCYVCHLVAVFREVRRVLRDDGTVFLNLGDSYAGSGAGGGGNRKGNEHGQHDAMALVGRPGVAPGLKPKDLCLIPARVALALQADGWYLRSDIIWAKGWSFCPDRAGSSMPDSTPDRPAKTHEYLFMLSKKPRYYFDMEAVKEPAVMKPQRRLVQRNSERDAHMRPDRVCEYKLRDEPQQECATRHIRSVWAINTENFKGPHFAVMPEALVEPCILAGSSARACPACGTPWRRVVERTGHINKREVAHVPNNTPTKIDSTGWAPVTKGTNVFTPACACGREADPVPSVILDPFAGTSTTGVVALKQGRNYVGIELNPTYVKLSEERLKPLLFHMNNPLMQIVLEAGD